MNPQDLDNIQRELEKAGVDVIPAAGIPKDGNYVEFMEQAFNWQNGGISYLYFFFFYIQIYNFRKRNSLYRCEYWNCKSCQYINGRQSVF